MGLERQGERSAGKWQGKECFCTVAEISGAGRRRQSEAG